MKQKNIVLSFIVIILMLTYSVASPAAGICTISQDVSLSPAFLPEGIPDLNAESEGDKEQKKKPVAHDQSDLVRKKLSTIKGVDLTDANLGLEEVKPGEWQTIVISGKSTQRKLVALLQHALTFEPSESMLVPVSEYRSESADSLSFLYLSPVAGERRMVDFCSIPGSQSDTVCSFSLSSKELYKLAYSYEMGSPDFHQILLMTEYFFPEQREVQLNAVASALSCGRLPEAKRILSSISSKDKYYYNNLGIYLLLQGQNTLAKEAFLLAAKEGLDAAFSNLTYIK